MPNYIGVDVGGTKIIAGLINAQGKVLRHMKMSTESHKGRDQVIENLIACIEEVFDKTVKGIGVGVPSPVDIKKGIVYETTNIPDWKNVNLVKILKDKFKVPIKIDNDANCFLIAEQKYGSAKKAKNAVGVVVGTGIGSSIMIEGNIYRGNTNAAGELGKIPYRGLSMEEYAAGPALKRISKYMGKPVSPTKLAEMARAKKAFAKQVFEEYGSNLGTALSILINTIDPEVIILGGSVANSYLLFKDTMIDQIKRSTFHYTFKKLQIKKSNLKFAGVIGAALLFKFKL